MARSGYKTVRLRPGFTLLELMVSVAVLLAVLAMVGTIFSSASKAGGQAATLTTAHRQISQAAERIRQDLANMQTSDVLAIAGMVVPNVPDKRNKDPNNLLNQGAHRADTLMLFTQRGDTRPYVANIGTSNPNDVLGSKVQVVYGHADVLSMGMLSPKLIEGTPSNQIPAYDWHLARRTVFFPASSWVGTPLFGMSGNSLGSGDFLSGLCDMHARSAEDYFTYYAVPAGCFSYLNNVLEKAYRLTQPAANNGYLYEVSNPWLYYDGTHWFRWDNGSGMWLRTEVASTISASPQPLDPTSLNSYLPLMNGLAGTLFYDGAVISHRTVIDPSPPVGAANALGSQFLSNCCDFRVEYTYDDPREVGDPGLPFPNYYGKDALDPTNASPDLFVTPIRWQQVAPGQQIIWSQLSANPGDRTNPYRWPRALRITLKAVDTGGRLDDDPVTYTLIHCFQ
ncbi:MAG: type II secretion system GspH family protein [Phycisphaerae bacterium]|nr:type II secretion system GspH family protein [Phycisphaerae bacterium]